jgi:ankyrin repeat protein
MVAAALKAGVDPNVTDKNGSTPLMQAAAAGDP